MKIVSPSVIIALLALPAGIASAQNTSVAVTVGALTGPWLWVNNGLNTAYQYCYGEEAAPTVVSAANGLPFSAGDNLTISYLSGDIAIAFYAPAYDAAGVPGFALNNLTGNYPPAPSYYMDPSTYPIYAGELVGTFANSSGEIVGTPFGIGDWGTFTVPAGGTQLQLGVNDDNYDDNSGSWNIQVAVPEPAMFSLLVLAGGTLLLGRRRN
ncbi:MAG: PEP-CTERM sorting domain-containing protein [Tepidisphaeraceae bacterium]